MTLLRVAWVANLDTIMEYLFIYLALDGLALLSYIYTHTYIYKVISVQKVYTGNEREKCDIKEKEKKHI